MRVASAPRPVTPVGILAATLAELSEQLDAVAGLDPGLTDALRHARDLAAGLDPYLGQCTTPESPALAVLARRTQAQDWNLSTGRLEQEMMSGHVEGQFLKFLVGATRARHLLEIGMFTGYSALAMAEALPEGGTVVACEVDADVAQFAQECFAQSPSGAKISVRVAPALDTLRELAAAGEVFDLVFIDADKPGYEAYLEILLATDLLAPHGLVCVDNTLMQGQPYLPGTPSENGLAIARFNQAVANDDRIEQVLLPLRDGLTLIRRAGR